MVVTKMSEDSLALSESGTKGYNLFSMTKAKLPVPEWIVIGTSAFKQFIEYSEIKHHLDQTLNSISLNQVSSNSLTCVSNTIRTLILSAPLPDDLEDEIICAYKSLNSNLIAVRSSVADKGSSQFSFAGQHSTFLDVTNHEDAIKYLKECWISAFSPQAISYRILHKISLTLFSIDMAVIFQKMILPAKSGMLFTCNNKNNDTESITINSLYGVGEGFLKGILDVDTYTFNKTKSRITSLSIVNKQFELKRELPNGGVTTNPLPKHLQTIPCLSNQEIIELANIANTVELHFNSPQEIEWAWTEKEGFCILQSRPVCIAPLLKKTQSQSRLSSNDLGNTLTYPLTFGFMEHYYHHAFLQLCQSMSMSKKEIHAIDPYLENMLGSIFGRTYFNILNLYHLTSLILPGIKNRRAYIDFTTGYQDIHSDSLSKREEKLPNRNTSRSVFRKLISTIRCFWYNCRMKNLMKQFCAFFDLTCTEFTSYDFSKMSADEIYKHYQILEKKVFTKWKIPSINNFLSMIYFKQFRSLTKRWLSHIDTNLEKDLLLTINSDSCRTIGSTKALARITSIIRQNKTLQDMVSNTTPEMCHHALTDPQFDDVNKIITKHLISDNHQNDQFDLTLFYSSIQNNLKHDKSISSLDKVSENEKEFYAEKLINKHLKGIRKYVYNKFLNKTRQAVKNREIAHSYKTRINGIVNSMFQGIGHDYARNNIIKNYEDIFYLDFEQLKNTLNGNLSTPQIQQLIQIKKEQYKNFKQIDPPARIVTSGPVYWLNNLDDQSLRNQAPARSLKLKGNSAFGGIIKAKVRVITDFSDIKDVHDEILVTSIIDSNLMQHFPTIAGLIVERGSQLSHTVTIAREFGVPVVIGVMDITSILKTGMTIRLDGTTGTIEVLNHTPKDVSGFANVKKGKFLIY